MTTDQPPTPSIEPRPDGSILVRGPIRTIGPDGREIETKEKFSLCRCGHSANRPFCDATHRTIDFTSRRESERSIDRYRLYQGVPEEVAVEDNRTICAHVAHCTNDLPEVFRREGRPWIKPEEGSSESIVALTHRCPSGALVARIDGTPVPEPEREPTIRIMPDGPYLVEGDVPLQIDDDLAPPVPQRYALCRCGASKNKPYCDGSHHQLEEGWGGLA